MTAKICCWNWRWQDASEKLATAADDAIAAAGADGDGGVDEVPIARLKEAKRSLRRRRGGIMEHDNDAPCSVARVSGHGPSDMQTAAGMFLPVVCAPPSTRRVLAEGDETVCFFMVWSASLGDRWQEEVGFGFGCGV